MREELKKIKFLQRSFNTYLRNLLLSHINHFLFTGKGWAESIISRLRRSLNLPRRTPEQIMNRTLWDLLEGSG